MIDGGEARALVAEARDAVDQRPGVGMLRLAQDDDAARFLRLLMRDEQHAQGGPAGDHFGKPGANDRIWNALEKLAASRGAPRLTADVSDSAEDFFKRRGFVPQQRNTVPLGDEWLANTTMEKKLAAKERTP